MSPWRLATVIGGATRPATGCADRAARLPAVVGARGVQGGCQGALAGNGRLMTVAGPVGRRGGGGVAVGLIPLAVWVTNKFVISMAW